MISDPNRNPITLWRGGWHAGARHCPSPHCQPRPQGCVIDTIVLHCISLPPGEFGGEQIARFFCGTLDCSAHEYFRQIETLRVSAHFLIDRQGALTQFVDCDWAAWHAGASAWRQRERLNEFSIGIELEGVSGGDFTPEQYAALAGLMQDCTARYPITQTLGHEDVAQPPGRKDDPGACFDWPRLQSLTGWGDEHFPGAAARQS